MRQTAVVIPYYQREAGVLTRALMSVFAQTAVDSLLTILVVNDASPIDPAPDIEAAGAIPANVEVRVLRRENGGPAAARNTGFEAAAAFADFIALLDSDDMWCAEHLHRAFAAIDRGADVYFSDFVSAEGEAYLPQAASMPALKQAGTADADAPAVLFCKSTRIAELAACEYLAHTSSLVFDAKKFGHLRMTEVLRSAGEDHLFFLDLALGADRIAISLEPDVQLGRGVNIYVGAFDWGSERDLRRRAFNLGALKMVRDRTHWPPDVRDSLRRRAAAMRRIIGFLLVRRTLSERALPLMAMQLTWHFDRSAVLLAPYNAAIFALMRISNREDFLLNQVEHRRTVGLT
jgi:succinoglycan biosynthesis protein ExoW